MSYETDTVGFFSPAGVAAIEASLGNDPVHERTVIREFFVTRISAAVSNLNRVHSDPTMAIQGRPDQYELPAINITTRSDPTEPYHKDAGGTKHTLELGVDIYGTETDSVTVERNVDALALGVETLILDDLGWPNSIHTVDLTGTERQFNSDGTRRLGVCQLTFTVTYTT